MHNLRFFAEGRVMGRAQKVMVLACVALLLFVLPPAATRSAGAAPSDSSDSGGQQQESYTLKLREIEERVNELKEKIFQSKARLIQLQEVVLHGAIAGSKATFVHRNGMGGSFKLWRVEYALDGTPVFNRTDNDTGDLADQDEIEIFSGSVAPGVHQITVFLEYRGAGFGFFTYLDEYKFKVRGTHTFNAEEGKVTVVKVTGYEKGGITTQLQDRPAVRFDVKTERALRDDAKKDGSADAK